MDEKDTTTSGATQREEFTRRDLIKGAAATGIIFGGNEYVKPALRVLGVTRLASATSTPPPGGAPPPSTSHGCTPGFWGNNSTGAQGGGVLWWNTANDPQWAQHGGSGTNPFTHATLFNSFFTAAPELVGETMWEVVNGGGGPTVAAACARQLVAAYLDASFASYPLTTTQLRTMWAAATNTQNTLINPDLRRDALEAFQALLDTTNNACDRLQG